jgi:hypothetical protein
MRARRPVRDVAAIDVDLEGFALISFAEGRGEGAVGVGLELAEEGGLLGLDLGVSQDRKRLLRIGDREAGRILVSTRSFNRCRTGGRSWISGAGSVLLTTSRGNSHRLYET